MMRKCKDLEQDMNPRILSDEWKELFSIFLPLSTDRLEQVPYGLNCCLPPHADVGSI